MPVRYEVLHVTSAKVEEYRQAIEAAPMEKRFGLFKRYNHFGTLNMQRAAGHHFNYLSSGDEIKYCTCGLTLVAPFDDIESIEAPTIELDIVQRAKGHMSLPPGNGLAVALITNFRYDQEFREYFCRAICQACLTELDWSMQGTARDFVKIHQHTCGSSSVAEPAMWIPDLP